MSSDSSSSSSSAEALRARGVFTGLADELATTVSPALIQAWCGYADQQPDWGGPSFLVQALRTGQSPPDTKRRLANEQREYADQIRDWLMAKLPDVCRQDERVVKACRRVFGDEDADRLAAFEGPHLAAVTAVIHLHHRLGRGRLTVREHGSEIRAAVRAADDQAVAEYEQINERRGQDGHSSDEEGAGAVARAEARGVEAGERGSVGASAVEAGCESEASERG